MSISGPLIRPIVYRRGDVTENAAATTPVCRTRLGHPPSHHGWAAESSLQCLNNFHGSGALQALGDAVCHDLPFADGGRAGEATPEEAVLVGRPAPTGSGQPQQIQTPSSWGASPPRTLLFLHSCSFRHFERLVLNDTATLRGGRVPSFLHPDRPAPRVPQVGGNVHQMLESSSAGLYCVGTPAQRSADRGRGCQGCVFFVGFPQPCPTTSTQPGLHRLIPLDTKPPQWACWRKNVRGLRREAPAYAPGREAGGPEILMDWGVLLSCGGGIEAGRLPG